MQSCAFAGLQWLKAELFITGSGPGTNRHAHDREGSQGWHVGRATELSLGHIMDAHTGESLRGNIFFAVTGSLLQNTVTTLLTTKDEHLKYSQNEMM